MVPSNGAAVDYEFVIWPFGRRGLRRPQSGPWLSRISPSTDCPSTFNPHPEEHTMNTRHLIAIAALALTAAGTALAQEATVEPVVSTGQASRADVTAEARQAARNGSLHESYHLNLGQPAAGERTRGDVRAEAVAALRSGEIARRNAEAWSFDNLLPQAAADTRLALSSR